MKKYILFVLLVITTGCSNNILSSDLEFEMKKFAEESKNYKQKVGHLPFIFTKKNGFKKYEKWCQEHGGYLIYSPAIYSGLDGEEISYIFWFKYRDKILSGRVEFHGDKYLLSSRILKREKN